MVSCQGCNLQKKNKISMSISLHCGNRHNWVLKPNRSFSERAKTTVSIWGCQYDSCGLFISLYGMAFFCNQTLFHGCFTLRGKAENHVQFSVYFDGICVSWITRSFLVGCSLYQKSSEFLSLPLKYSGDFIWLFAFLLNR